MNPSRILVVEDEKIVAMDVASSLSGRGYEVAGVVSTGEEAVLIARSKPVDLVVMDIRLKGDVDGLQAAEQLRRYDIPVVYLTAYADESTLERAKITNSMGYILKPFEDKELYTIVEIALYRHKMEKQLKEHQQRLATTLESIGEAVVSVSREGRIDFMNHVAESLTGWGQSDAGGLAFAEVVRIVDDDTGDPVASLEQRVIHLEAEATLIRAQLERDEDEDA